MRPLVSLVIGLALGSGCTSGTARYAEGPSCEERQAQLVSVLKELPDTMLNTSVRVALPNATLAGSFGPGTIVELDGASVSVNGERLEAPTQPERAAKAAAHIAQLTATAGSPEALYIAASADVDIRSLHAYLSALPEQREVRLLFARPATQDQPDPDLHDSVYAGQLLTERDPARRRAIAQAGYEEYSNCQAVDQVIASLQDEPASTRWPTLRQRMVQAIPTCTCSDIDPDGLRHLLVAEQRAGAVALGSVTASFLGDIRCRATMPLRSVQQLLQDIEAFEAEFSGRWTESELTFDDVVTHDRLLTYLCVAMPGEVLESVQRGYERVYVRTSTVPECRALEFAPIAKGAPFGTLYHTTPAGKVGFHYRQGGNEIRIFGPAPEGSRPTDDGPWGCDSNLKMSEVDASSIHIEGGGRFYLTEEACQAATGSEALLQGCTLDPNVKAPEAQPEAPTAVTPSPDTPNP